MLIDHNFSLFFSRQQQPLRRKHFMTSTIPLTMSMNPTLWFRLRVPSIRRSPRQVIPTSSWSTLNAMPRPACWWRSSSKRCSRASFTRKATSRIQSAGKDLQLSFNLRAGNCDTSNRASCKITMKHTFDYHRALNRNCSSSLLRAKMHFSNASICPTNFKAKQAVEIVGADFIIASLLAALNKFV